MRWSRGIVLAALAVPGAALAANAPPPYRPAGPGGPAGPIELSQPWALPAAGGADTSVMFSLRNYGDVADDLLHAACAGADSAELVGEPRNGAAPAHLGHLALAPGQKIGFTPEGPHLVLHRLNTPVRVGETLHCTASFAKSGERLFEADVRQSAPPPAPPI